MLRRLPSLLLRPVVGGLAGGLLVALALVPPEPVEIRTVTERIIVPGTTKVVEVRRVIERCDTSVVTKLLNEVLRSHARTGEAGVVNEAGVDGGGDISQTASATSGDAVLGQVIEALAVCGTVTINANNTVTDSKAVTGDAEAGNEATVPAPTPEADDGSSVLAPSPDADSSGTGSDDEVTPTPGHSPTPSPPPSL